MGEETETEAWVAALEVAEWPLLERRPSLLLPPRGRALEPAFLNARRDEVRDAPGSDIAGVGAACVP